MTLLAHTLHRNAEALGADKKSLFDCLWDLGNEIMGDQTTMPKRDQRIRYSKQKQLDLTRDKDSKPGLAAFLARTPDARLDALPDAFGHDDAGTRQRLPGEQGGDGFFQARLLKLR